jgi:hypothetical protein
VCEASRQVNASYVLVEVNEAGGESVGNDGPSSLATALPKRVYPGLALELDLGRSHLIQNLLGGIVEGV